MTSIDSPQSTTSSGSQKGASQTTTIQVDEDTAKVLTEMATAHHMTVAGFLRSLAARGVATRPGASAADFDEELESLLFDGPTLPADFSRADLYRDHD